jgi:Putative transposase DNA-binding domain
MRKRKEARQVRAITHIALGETNRGKLAALDALWAVYREVCQQYVTHFCGDAQSDQHAAFRFPSVLSARWQRVAVRQAAGIAQSWRTNRQAAYQDYTERLTYYEGLSAEQQAKRRAPVWREWQPPTLRAMCIQANANVALRVSDDYAALKVEPAEHGCYDFWLRVSTLDKGRPIYLPVKLAAYHQKALGDLKPNSSVELNRRKGKWWLTLSVDEPLPAVEDVPRGTVGGDVGIRNYLTDSQGRRYGGVDDRFSAKVQRIREKTSRKAKLRRCLARNGVENLPSTHSALSERLSRQVKQDINRAVKEFLADHAQDTIAVEALAVGAMRFKARRMNRYLKASQLGYVLKQLRWAAAKRGIPIVTVPAAYSSQACPRCHFADRANRPSQQTFCCQVCGYAGHADVVAARNLECRLADQSLSACRDKGAIKHLLDQRHARWRADNGYP